MDELTREQKKDLKVLAAFIRLYCAGHHGEREPAPSPPEVAEIAGRPLPLCSDCSGLLQYALLKRRRCPLDPKPSCKHCHIHCYSKEYRAKIREIMAWSGKRMILRGRLDYLYHYFF